MSNIALKDRAKWIGASEVAILLGVSPFSSPFELWWSKKLERHDELTGERLDAGKFFEPAIAAWAEDRWDWPLLNINDYMQHPTIGRFGASLDFAVEDAMEPVEIKNVDGLMFRDHWEAEGDEIIDAPIHYLLQLQAQMAMMPESRQGWLVVCVGGNRLFRMCVARHEKTIAKIEREVEGFWASIDQGIEPAPDYNQDADFLATLYAAAGVGKLVDLTGDNHATSLCHEYKAAGEDEKAAKKRKDAAKAELIDIIREKTGMSPENEDAEKGKILLDGFSITLSPVHEADVAYVRKAYTSMRINTSKPKKKEAA